MRNYKKQMLSLLILLFYCFLSIATTVNHKREENEKNDFMTAYDKSFATGKCAFIQYCQPCHGSLEKYEKNNPLNGVFNRFPAPPDTFFVRFISDSKALRDSGNAYANAIHQSGRRNYDHKFQYVFGPKELEGLITYMKRQSSMEKDEE
jgi:cytochrome c2